jgi:hypothetical protein
MGNRYLNKDRLADVLALIQVLALDEKAKRSEDGLRKELQGQPRSSDSWQQLGKEHPEFFRVHDEADVPISLVARYVTPSIGDGKRAPLDGSLIQLLVRIAVDMHDREAKRSKRLACCSAATFRSSGSNISGRSPTAWKKWNQV